MKRRLILHTLLEANLEQVAVHLSALPVKRRDEELREIRQHLLNAVTVNQELGQSEDDAAANAVMQFGTPEDLGENLVWAWKRERSLNRKSFWGAASAALVLNYCLVWLLPAAQPLFHLFRLWVQSHSECSSLTVTLLSLFFYALPIYFSIGAAVGRLFPRRAVAGTALLQGGWFVLDTVHWVCWNMLHTPYHPRSEYLLFQYVIVNAFFMEIFFTLPILLATILGAWLVSRQRLQGARRSRQAVGLE